MTPEIRATLERALDMYRGDNLELAKRQYRNCTPEEMQQEDGFGMTRAQILAMYQKKSDAVDEALAWVRGQA